MFQSIYTKIISNIQKYLGKGSDWIIYPVIDHTISILNYNPLSVSSYIKLSKELDHPRIGFINIQNIDDNECFKWRIVRYLNSADYKPGRITKADKEQQEKKEKDTIFLSKILILSCMITFLLLLFTSF